MNSRDLIKRAAAVTVANYAADEHPYGDLSVPGSFSEYNRGWHDACDYIKAKLDAENAAQKRRVGAPEPNIIQKCSSRGKPVGKPVQLGWVCPFCGNMEVWKFCPECGAEMDWAKTRKERNL